MGWLTGYDKRKLIPLTGSSGAGTNYPVFLTAYADKHYFSADGSGATALAAGLNLPVSAYYNGYTYVGHQGRATTGDGDPYITKISNTGGTSVKSTKCGTSTLSIDDSHGQPCVLVRTDSGHVGKIMVVFGGHNGWTNPQWVESTNAEDITAWGAQAGIGSLGSFPKIVQVANGDIYCFYRSGDFGAEGRKWAYRKMAAGESSWGAEVLFLDMSDAGEGADEPHLGGLAYDSTNNKIYFTMAYYDSSATNDINQYVLAYCPTDDKVYDAAGNGIAVPADAADLNNAALKFLIYTSGVGEFDVAGGLALDSNQRPHIVYAHYLADTTFAYKYTAWNGSAWSSPASVTTFATTLVNITYYVSPGMILTTTSDIDVYLSVLSGDLEQWHYDGATWSKTRTVRAMSSEPAVCGLALGCAQVPWGHATGVDIVFCSMDLTVGNAEKRVYAYSAGAFVEAKCAGIINLGGLAQADFDDVRFTAVDGSTALDFTLMAPEGSIFPTKTDSNQATFLVEVAADLDTDQNIFCYYQKADATYGGDINAAVLFGDDFELNNLTRWTADGTIWTVNAVTMKHGLYAALGDGGDVEPDSALAKTITLASTGLFVVHFWFRPTVATDYICYLACVQTTDKYPLAVGPSGGGGSKVQYLNAVPAWADFTPALTYAANTWYEIIVYIDLPNNKFMVKKNGVETAWITDVLTTADITQVRFVAYNVEARDVYLDDFYIRKWLETEPVVGVPGVQTIPSVPPSGSGSGRFGL